MPIQQETPFKVTTDVIHLHRVSLKEGQILESTLSQEGVDVEIDLLNPKGEKIFSIDSPTGNEGEEDVLFIAESSGEYVLRVKGNQEGTYWIQGASIRLASVSDQIEAELEEAFHLAREIRREKPAQAMKGFQQVADLSRRAKRRASAFERIGDIFATQKQWKESLASHRKARSLYRALKDQESEARMLSSEGISLKGLERLEDAEESCAEAIEVATKAGSHEQAAIAFMCRGVIRRLKGQSLAALKDFEASLSHWRRIESHLDRRLEALGNIVHLEGQLGRYPKAFQVAEEGIRESRGLAVAVRAKILSRIAGVFRSRGDRSDLQWARNYAEWSLNLRQQAGEATGIANTLVELSLIHRSMGNLSEARKLLEEALLLFRSKQDLTGEATVLVNMGMVLYEQQDFRQSIDRLQEALRIAKRQELRVVQAVALYTFALAEYQRGRHEEAKARAKAAVELVDSDEHYVPIEGLEDLYLETRQGVYDLLIEISVASVAEQTSPQDLQLAFEAFERGRSRKMLEILGPVRLRLTPDLVPLELLEERGRLLRKLQGLREEEGSVLEDLEKVDTQIKVSHPWYPMASPAKPVTLDEALELLDDGTVLVGFKLMNSRSLAFVVTRSSQEIFELPPRAGIEKNIYRFHAAISQEPSKPLRADLGRFGKQLSKDLLAPFAHRLASHSRLVIIPDGLAQIVPFGALPHPKSGVPLVQTHEVVFEPSFSALKAIRGALASREPPDGPLAVFAVSDYKGRLAELRNSIREATALLEFFRGEVAPPFHAFDHAATRDAAMSGVLSQHKVLHVAAHAQSHPEHPELSRIALYDGDLTAREIQDMELRADLVVLSACETALGAEVRGEGQVGLAHAFIYAGAARVVASLWEVNDAATSEFMVRFYYEMHGNDENESNDRTPAEALKATQVWMSKHEKWSAPYYWAGFQLIGEWR